MNTSVSVYSKSKKIVIGTRRSALAKWQSNYISKLISSNNPDISVELYEIVTKGDLSQAKDEPLPSIGGKGLFTAELEEALTRKEIDLAVHSLKDLPTEHDPRFCIAAIPERGPVNDILVSKNNCNLSQLKPGAVIGSSSFRRSAQLLSMRPDLKIESIRGNVDTRVAKAKRSDLNYDGVVLAMAGIERLALSENISQIFTYQEMLPAAAQGALAVQCRNDDEILKELLFPINHKPTEQSVIAERAFLAALGAGCNMPVACLAEVIGNELNIVGRCLSHDGKQVIEVRRNGLVSDAKTIGQSLAEDAINKGAKKLICSGN